MRRHRFEGVAFVFGVLFTGGGLWFLQGDVDVWHLDWSWLWPALLVLSGVMVLLSLRPDAPRTDPRTDPDADPTGTGSADDSW